MRILGYIDHPQLKITVFKTDERLSIKFENEGYEQTFKIGLDERVNNLESARRFTDQVLVSGVIQRMQEMHKARITAMERNFKRPGEGV